MRSGSRRSFRHAASRDAMPSRLSTPRSSSTPTSDDSIPPSNATLTFLRATAGSSKGRSVSCSMTGVALLDRSRETASTTESCDESRLSATSVAQNIGASRIGTVSTLAGRLVGTTVQLANGQNLQGMLGNVNLTNPLATRHFLSLAVWIEGHWFHLARYHDVDREDSGPEVLAATLGLPVTDVFPITYDLSGIAEGAP